MEPILKTVAREYSLQYPSLKELCFLFPNKRCIVFLRKYFAENGILTEDLPHILTITEFMQQTSRRLEAGRIQQLFTLYKSYLEVISGEEQHEEEGSLEFEEFKGWGEIVLSDFNTVDTYLAEPSEIFKNVKDFREITSNFITEEQKEVMRDYFGIEYSNNEEGFWKSFQDPEQLSVLKKKFLNLWQVLLPLYELFHKKLNEEGLDSTGGIYREACERLSIEGETILPYKKIVAVGFNALTESERRTFKMLQKLPGKEGFDDFIDFIWDATGPILQNDDFTASRFIDYNKKHFPMPEWLEEKLIENEVTTWPQIRIIAAPSNTAQTKVAGEVLKENLEKGLNIASTNEFNTAVVLPDEALLPNLLFSIPDEIESVNVTMGLSLKQSPVASFFFLLRRVYSTLRTSKNNNIFYVKDLRLLLSHPYSYILFQKEDIDKFFAYLDKYHKISVSQEILNEYLPLSETLLSFPQKKEKGYGLFPFLENIINTLQTNLEANFPEGEKAQDIAEINVYGEYLHDFEDTLRHYNIEMSSQALLQMADRLIAGEKIGFEGEPLSGLQIMGTLETRSLDFKNIIILSMNEGIMPRKSTLSTFIPETLRKSFGLPPARYAEEIFAYYFYRLLSRAENVTLIYDGRTITGMRNGESRYILQLKEYAPKEKLTLEAWKFRIHDRQKTDATILKSPEIKYFTEVFSSEGEDRRNLSASSLNNYRECQVKFFLQNILNLNIDPSKGDYIDPITMGNILHETMLEIYIPDKTKQRRLLKYPVKITREYLEKTSKDEEFIKDLVRKKTAKFYFKENEDTPVHVISGVIELITEQIVELVKSILTYDVRYAPFNIFGCEIERNLRIRLKTGREVNFRFAIDRLDEIEIEGIKRLRIIDYKTGSKKRDAESIEQIFAGGRKSEQLFQLFVYAWLLGKIGAKGWEEVSTEIYFVPDLVKDKRGLPTIDEEPVTSFKPFIEEFSERLEEMIEDIFISDSFKEPSDKQNCETCGFNSYCFK